MPPDPQAFYQTTAEPVVPEHTVQTKPEMGESSAPLPVGFKTPKFNKYDGTGNPKTHLHLFANKLGRPVDDENLPLRLFPESLEGDALDWYSNLKPKEVKTWLDLSNAFIRQYEYNCRPLDQLKAAGKIGMVPPPTYPYGMPAWYNPQAVCAYHSGAPGHSTVDCKALKHRIQDMIEAREIVIRKKEAQGTNINRNPLPEHANTIGVILDDAEYEEQVQKLAREAEVFGVTDQPFIMEVPFEEDKRPFILDLTLAESKALEPVVIEFPEQEPVLSLQRVPWNYDEPVIQIGEKSIAKEEVSVVTRSGRIASPFGATVPIQVNNPELPAKPTVTEKEALDFLKRLQRSEYIVVEKLSKSPAQISMLDLLFSSDMHRDALLEMLTKAQIPKDISVANFSHVVGSVLFTKQITFSDDELPAKGIGHNKALYIAVSCNGKILPKVLIDNGSALNICPWSTLEKLGLQDIKLRPSGTIVRGFDGARREPIGEVDLVIEMGPAQFQIACQVMHFPSVYNVLVGRPWIHKSGAVPSSLHQLLKFIVNDKLITIFAEEDCLVIADSGSKEDGSRSAIVTPHSTADIVSVSWITKEERALSKASVMMAKEMIRGGYEFDKGLGRDLQGILKPVKIVEKKDSFGLGFRPTARDIKEMKECKRAEKEGRPRALDIPPLHYTFPRPTEEMLEFLTVFQDVFAWSYDDMTGISTDVVVHKLPTDPTFPPVKQKSRKFKPDMSLKIKEQIEKQLKTNIIIVSHYPIWLSNPVPVPKKNGEVRVCVDYRDLNKASPKDDFPLPNIHILLDNTAGHEIESFCDCFAGYHQILMAEEDREKTAFITPWGTFCYRVMPFGLKNAGATYQRTMTTLFHDMIHREMEVYVDDIIIKSKRAENHLVDLKKLFERLRKYNLKLNPAKCAFGAPAGKLLGFIISKRGIEIDPAKIKAIRDMPVPKTQKDVKSFLGKINFIGRFIAQLTATCEPLFKLLRKNVPLYWSEECQQAFDKIKDYLLHPPVLVPPKPGRPLIMYLSVLEEAVGCVLGQHDDSGRKEQAIYYLSKKFTQYEANYSFIEKSCCTLAWAAQKLRHYLLSHTTYLISRSDPLKYLLEKPMLTGRLAKWQIILSEFDIVFTSQKAVKGQAIADHLAENPRDDDYQPLHTYFPDEKVLFVGATDDISEQSPEWRLFFDAKLQFACTNNMAEYEACIFCLKIALEMEIKELIAFSDSDLLVHQTLKQWITKDSKILPYHSSLLTLAKQFQNLEFRHLPRARNAFADALATLASMIQYPDELRIEPIQIQLQDKPAHCWVVDKSSDNIPWYNDIKEFLKTGSYPLYASTKDKSFLRRMASNFFLSGEVLYKRTSDLNLLRCIDEDEAQYMMKEVHSGVCGPHMNGHLLAKKIMRTVAPWPCSMWGMDVIGTIDPPASNGHRFILVAIEYFTKWVEAESFKHVTKKVVANFLRDHIICRFGVPETLITDNAKNLNNDMVDGLCEQFKIKHRNSAIYRPQMNGAVEAANKNLKKILMYGMEAVLPAEVEIPSLQILMEAKLEEADWIKQRHEQLTLIDEKRFNAICHGQCYQKRVARAYNKKVHRRAFEEGDKVLKRILPMQDEAKGKFAPNWQRPFIVQKALPGGALILAEMDGRTFPQPINSDMCKKFFI
ncbi:LOW QUALITY PROTEIN: uncharacterized protein LOC113768604 [Coffea eugenioides]|uniref:LOW QUALITY PROTEIN: uncharacterized protein LOC113768604 n=1 Tax=Coffea eugenioides TaxID=49369 RepID=UPI000F604960|nr:LOW QUALITY PROTEIN: uncharacterized protein LOC113768604 [Coffea eugenioides]